MKVMVRVDPCSPQKQLVTSPSEVSTHETCGYPVLVAFFSCRSRTFKEVIFCKEK